jgi:hypothetical protein
MPSRHRLLWCESDSSSSRRVTLNAVHLPGMLKAPDAAFAPLAFVLYWARNNDDHSAL